MEPKGSSKASTRAESLSLVETIQLHNFGLLREVTRARSLLELKEDWDERGSVGYGEGTLNRAARLFLHVHHCLDELNSLDKIHKARILPGADGNIDIEITSFQKRLLISVSADPENPYEYFGRETDRRYQTKGYLDPNRKNQWLMRWFAE